MNVTAFSDSQRIASGSLPSVVENTKHQFDRNSLNSLLIFDDLTGKQIDIDFNGALETILAHLPPTASVPAQKAGRPKLGVSAKEITLLPRHWEWLATQPGGASVTLRKLVENARRADQSSGQSRRSQEACYQFLQAIAGNLPGFEAVSRALFSGNAADFETAMSHWPDDIQIYAKQLLVLSDQ